MLTAVGFKIKADGAYGQNTERAVIALQKKCGLVPDGVVGPKTAGVISAMKAANAAPRGTQGPQNELQR